MKKGMFAVLMLGALILGGIGGVPTKELGEVAPPLPMGVKTAEVAPPLPVSVQAAEIAPPDLLVEVAPPLPMSTTQNA